MIYKMQTNRERFIGLKWQYGTPVSHIQQVWHYVTELANNTKRTLSTVSLKYYNYSRSMEHDKQICTLMRSSPDEHNVIHNAITGKESDIPGDLSAWISRIMQAHKKLEEVYTICTNDIYSLLMAYCSNYQAMGYVDNEMYVVYRSKIIGTAKALSVVKNLLTLFKSSEKFFMKPFVPELLQCECLGGHIWTKIVPTIIDHLSDCLNLSLEWVRSDKIYIDELKKSMHECEGEINRIEKKLKLASAEHEANVSNLKKERAVLASLNEELRHFDKSCVKESNKQLQRLDFDISALKTAIASLKDGNQEADIADWFMDNPVIVQQRKDEDQHYYKQKMKKIEKQRDIIFEHIQNFQRLQTEKLEKQKEIETLEKKLKKTRRNYKELTEKKEFCNDKVESLRKIYEKRTKPDTNEANTDLKDMWDVVGADPL